MSASRRAWSLLGLLLVPLVVAGGFLWATWDFDSRLERVEAAVVNLDEPVSLDGQLVPLGRQLAGGLVEGPDEENFRWTLTDAADAADGLASGRYAAAVTIPKSFSARATSFAANDADQAERATIEVQTSQVSGIADPVVGQAITAAATSALNTSLTQEYLRNIYLGFNQLNGQFGTLADGAGRLASGADDLAGGLKQSAAGSAELADGLTGLDRGTAQLAGGASDLSDGASQLSTGLSQLSGGVARTARGAGELADGADGLADGTHDLTAGARRLARGADDLAGGVNDLRKGTRSRPGGTSAYAAGAADFAAGLEQYQGQMSGFATQTDAQLSRVVPCPAELPSTSCPVFYAGLRAGTRVATQGLEDQGDQPGLLSGAAELADGAAGIDAGLGRLETGAETYAAGVDRFVTGAGRLATGADRLATGVDDLAGGIDRLATGARASAAGARDLATGAGQLSTGTSELATATGLSADGAKDLSDGLGRLSGGGQSLAEGTKEFADGLAKGQREVPTYSAGERDRLSQVVSAPVTAPSTDGATYSDIATTTLLVVLALWLGGLACFVVLRPVTARVLASMKPSWRLAVEGLAPAWVIAAIQAVVLSAVLNRLLDLSASQTTALALFALLTAGTFVAVNHALVSLLGGLGRLLSVAVAVSVAAGALTAAAPQAFAAIAPFLPVTPALQGIRALVSGGSGGPAAIGLLLGWLLLAVSISVLAVARQRMLRLPDVREPRVAVAT